ncbi:MAG: efflux RND transporter permease subunit, partial [Thiovulaceae bacterium]|nr:efflux RND transporter permease subunit [Sulfurimonadaceae bacterium]
MGKLIEFFIHNKALNYTLLIFLAYLGFNAYINIPKEMFPNVELEKISVRGAYSGSSATIIDKMAVRDIEDALSNINGIDKSETTIIPGSFIIILTLNEHSNKINILSKVKDSISASKQYLPSDMLEPTAKLLDKSKSLIKLSVSSSTLSRGELTKISQDIRSKIARIKHISDVSIRGDSNEEVSIKINSKAVSAYRLKPQSVLEAISNLSYIFPIGDIEQKDNFVFISTVNGKTSTKEWESSILNIDGRYIELGDIAKV